MSVDFFFVEALKLLICHKMMYSRTVSEKKVRLYFVRLSLAGLSFKFYRPILSFLWLAKYKMFNFFSPRRAVDSFNFETVFYAFLVHRKKIYISLERSSQIIP